MKNAIITGSFDPVTSGHTDLILRASQIFDNVYAVILANTEKAGGAFHPKDRLALLERAIADLPCRNASVIAFLRSLRSRVLPTSGLVASVPKIRRS